MKAAVQRPEVAYIAGYGRSGSTLLDTLLDNSPHVFGAGELTWLFREAHLGGACSCGTTLPRCSFWQLVFERVFAEVGQLDLESAAKITLRAEALFPSRAAQRQYGLLWKSTLSAICQLSGRRIIADSSKMSRLEFHRLQLLRCQAGADVKVLHLVRDPRAVMWSVGRGSNRRLEAGQAKRRLGGMTRGFGGWLFSNLATDLVCSTEKDLPRFRLRYEDLVADPSRSLGQLGDFLGISLDCVLDRIRRGAAFQAGHGIMGNRMRRTGKIVLRQDNEWAAKLPAHARLIALAARPLMWKYAKPSPQLVKAEPRTDHDNSNRNDHRKVA